MHGQVTSTLKESLHIVLKTGACREMSAFILLCSFLKDFLKLLWAFSLHLHWALVEWSGPGWGPVNITDSIQYLPTAVKSNRTWTLCAACHNPMGLFYLLQNTVLCTRKICHSYLTISCTPTLGWFTYCKYMYEYYLSGKSIHIYLGASLIDWDSSITLYRIEMLDTWHLIIHN